MNSKREQRLWTSNQTDNYERQTEKDDFEHRNREDMVALNAKLKMDDSKHHNWEWMAALNVELQGNDEGGKYTPV